MNSITNLLDLEDTDIEITDIQIHGQTKTLTLSTPPVPHFCPSCGFRMYSRGIKKRTINHPILQDNYSLVLILKQRRWRCTNPECLYDTSESFKFVNRQRRTTNATDMLIVDAYRNLLETSVSIAKKFHVSDSHAHDVSEDLSISFGKIGICRIDWLFKILLSQDNFLPETADIS